MQSIVLLLWFALCAEQDVRQRRIANGLTLGGATVALAYLFATGHTWMGASPADAGWALAIVILLTLPGYTRGQLGGGDVKLLAALALASDYRHVLGTFIGAGLAMIFWLVLGPRIWKRLSPRSKKLWARINPPDADKQPFAPFLLSGFLISLLWIH